MPLSADERLEILDLYGRYSLHFDAGEPDHWAALFSPDGRFLAGEGVDLQGAEELASFVRARHRAPGLRHFVTGITIDDGDGAIRGSAHVLVLRFAADNTLRVFAIGHYDDEFTKIDGKWRFRTRKFSTWLPEGVGDIPISQP